jgi:urea transport system ATP-binding protein
MNPATDAIASASNTSSPRNIMLQVSNLNVYYGESHILRDVDLSVPTGEMICLIGRNGVGKTTLLKSIMGLIRPRNGAITFAGEPITVKSPDQRAKLGIGYVPQSDERLSHLDIKENLL